MKTKITITMLICFLFVPSFAHTKMLVGLLTEQFSEDCQETSGDRKKSIISDRHYEIGFTRLSGKEAIRGRNFVGRLVQAQGKVNPWPEEIAKKWLDALKEKRFVLPPTHARALASYRNCPPFQARSDWVSSSGGGIRLKRDNLQEIELIESFELESLSPFTGLSVKQREKEILVRFTNTFPFPLPAVKLIAHYEGCFKKPGVTTRSSSLGTLVPGANQEKNFPLFLTEEEAFEERSFYRIHSIQLWSEGGETLFDLDWPLSSDKNLSISCPDSGKK